VSVLTFDTFCFGCPVAGQFERGRQTARRRRLLTILSACESAQAKRCFKAFRTIASIGDPESFPQRIGTTSSLFNATASSTTSGCWAATRNSTRAAPGGLRRPCSQLCSVFTEIPIKAANLLCDSFIRSARGQSLLLTLLGRLWWTVQSCRPASVLPSGSRCFVQFLPFCPKANSPRTNRSKETQVVRFHARQPALARVLRSEAALVCVRWRSSRSCRSRRLRANFHYGAASDSCFGRGGKAGNRFALHWLAFVSAPRRTTDAVARLPGLLSLSIATCQLRHFLVLRGGLGDCCALASLS